jgi:hypothetical protein
VNTTGVTTFGGAISGLNSLVTNAGGSTAINGGALGVTGSFRFDDPVTLGVNTVITGPTGRFNSALLAGGGGGQTLAVNVSGDMIFVGTVGTTGQRFGSITTDAAGRTLFYGGAAFATGTQDYNDAVLLGGTSSTTFGASALTFNSTVNNGQPLSSLLSDGTISAATSGETDLIANVSGATVFNAAVGQTSRIGDVLTDLGGTTVIRAAFSATKITLNDNATFSSASGSAFTVDTTGAQIYAGTVAIGTDNLIFNSTLSAAFSTTLAEGINFQQGLTAPNLTLTLRATTSTISAGGDIGSSTSRLTKLTAVGRNMVIGGDVWTEGDMLLDIGTTGGTDNDFLMFAAPGGAARNTRLDSATGEIILGSGASGGTAKTAAPQHTSIFKSNQGDLFIFGRKVTVQPFERLAARNGSLIAIADGTATVAADGTGGDGLTLSSTAATNYLVLVSNAPGPSIRLRSRDGTPIESAATGVTQDQGTELIGGAVIFYSGGFGDVPTRQNAAPDQFIYQLNTGNIPRTNNQGVLAITILPDSGGVQHDVFVADLVLSNQFRPTLPSFLVYLDLETATQFTSTGINNGVGPFIDPTRVDTFGAVGAAPLRGLTSSGANARASLSQTFTPTAPIEQSESAPPEVDLAPAVREQLQALGIYARALRPEERRSQKLRKGLYVSVPERERPRESDYEVADARVEDKAVREVIRLATATGLIGLDQHKLDDVAKSLAASYEAFTAVATSTEAKDFRAWLETNKEADAVRVLDYLKTLQETLKRIELLGLTRQELESSKAQIYGSILRARLNTEPEFLRTLVEGAQAATLTASNEMASPAGALAQVSVR